MLLMPRGCPVELGQKLGRSVLLMKKEQRGGLCFDAYFSQQENPSPLRGGRQKEQRKAQRGIVRNISMEGS